MTVLPVLEEDPSAAERLRSSINRFSVQNFDVNEQESMKDNDRQACLACIETCFGNYTLCDEIIRDIFKERLDSALLDSANSSALSNSVSQSATAAARSARWKVVNAIYRTRAARPSTPTNARASRSGDEVNMNQAPPVPKPAPGEDDLEPVDC